MVPHRKDTSRIVSQRVTMRVLYLACDTLCARARAREREREGERKRDGGIHMRRVRIYNVIT